MFVNVSGDAENVSESFYSLTFASRCRATALGEARRNVTSLRKAGSPTALLAAARGPSPKYVLKCYLYPPAVVQGGNSSTGVVHRGCIGL